MTARVQPIKDLEYQGKALNKTQKKDKMEDLEF